MSINIEAFAFILIAWATAGALAFVFVYAAIAPWWESREGRHMMMLTLGLAALGTFSSLRRVLGEWFWYDEAVIVVYAVLGWELWKRVWLLVSAQVRDYNDGDR